MRYTSKLTRLKDSMVKNYQMFNMAFCQMNVSIVLILAWRRRLHGRLVAKEQGGVPGPPNEVSWASLHHLHEKEGKVGEAPL